jgi:hypothetical protein
MATDTLDRLPRSHVSDRPSRRSRRHRTAVTADFEDTLPRFATTKATRSRASHCAQMHSDRRQLMLNRGG